MGKLRHLEVQLARGTQQAVAVQVLAPSPAWPRVSGWAGEHPENGAGSLQAAPWQPAAEPEQGTWGGRCGGQGEGRS